MMAECKVSFVPSLWRGTLGNWFYVVDAEGAMVLVGRASPGTRCHGGGSRRVLSGDTLEGVVAPASAQCPQPPCILGTRTHIHIYILPEVLCTQDVGDAFCCSCFMGPFRPSSAVAVPWFMGPVPCW